MAVNKFDNSMFDAGTIGTTANKLLQLDGSAKIPAVDGSLITGVPSSFTKSASDPTLTTNPSGGVGSLWINTTSGEAYCCTDATAGENVWTNIGAGSDNIVPWEFGGSSYGYMCGDISDHSINRFPFASDGNAVDWGDLAGTARYMKTGHSDKDNSYGYHAGGYGPPNTPIARFSMTSSGTSNEVGDLTQITSSAASATNATHCYTIGHEYNAGGGGDGTVVSRYAFAASVDATDWSDLMYQQYGGGGATHGAGTYGYMQGGYDTNPNHTNRIQKVNLTTAAIATDVADTTQARQAACGNSSSTHGYNHGGHMGSTSNVTDKFNMSTDANSTDVGDMLVSAHQRGGSSSLTYAYVAGSVNSVTNIDKHSFATDGNATDVGDLAQGMVGPAGTQV